MNKVGLFDHPVLTEHQTGALHVERPSRVIALRETFEALPLVARVAEPVDLALVKAVHRTDVVDALAATAGTKTPVHLDPDTVVSARSWDAALISAGASVQAVEAVMSAQLDSAFVIARPPGHHAESDRAMGFCLLNNIAIAAAHALKSCKRVAIIDWDVHHGNGTQWIFYGDPRALYVSLHRYPFYPGTGAAEELGHGAGLGANLNLPFPGGVDDATYAAAFERVIVPKLRAFAPELILVSAGYDAHEDDPLGGMKLSADAFRSMTRDLVDVTTALSIPKPILVLEGGYSLKGLAASAQACVEELLSPTPRVSLTAPAHALAFFDQLRALHQL